MDEQSSGELGSHFGHGGPVEIANAYMFGLLELGEFAAAFAFCDDNFRLAQAQGWLWANRSLPEINAYDMDAAAAGLAHDGVAHPLWEWFAATGLGEIRDVWKHVNVATLGAASRPRPVDIDLELVFFVDCGGRPIVFDEPTLLDDAIVFTMRFTPAGWRIAAIGDRVPVPGWPPTFPGAE